MTFGKTIGVRPQLLRVPNCYVEAPGLIHGIMRAENQGWTVLRETLPYDRGNHGIDLVAQRVGKNNQIEYALIEAKNSTGLCSLSFDEGLKARQGTAHWNMDRLERVSNSKVASPEQRALANTLLQEYRNGNVSSFASLAKSDRFIQIHTMGPEPLRGNKAVQPLPINPAPYPGRLPANIAYSNSAYYAFLS